MICWELWWGVEPGLLPVNLGFDTTEETWTQVGVVTEQ